MWRLYISVILMITGGVAIAGQTIKQTDMYRGRVAYINTGMFMDETHGIREYGRALQQLRTEFKPQEDALLAKSFEIQKLVSQLPASPLTDRPLSKEEVDLLTRKIDRLNAELKEDMRKYDAMIHDRKDELLEIPRGKVAIAMKEFAKINGYTTLVDISELSGDDGSRAYFPDVTQQFIDYYNKTTEFSK